MQAPPWLKIEVVHDTLGQEASEQQEEELNLTGDGKSDSDAKDNNNIQQHQLYYQIKVNLIYNIIFLMLLTHNPLDKQVTRPELLWEKG